MMKSISMSLYRHAVLYLPETLSRQKNYRVDKLGTTYGFHWNAIFWKTTPIIVLRFRWYYLKHYFIFRASGRCFSYTSCGGASWQIRYEESLALSWWVDLYFLENSDKCFRKMFCNTNGNALLPKYFQCW